MKYLPSLQIQAELVRHGLEQFCPGIELDDRELSQLVADYSAHPAHEKESDAEILDRAAYFLIWRDYGVPQAGKAAEDVTAKRITVMHESLREMVREHFPKMAEDFAAVKESASIQAGAGKILGAQFSKFSTEHVLANLQLRGDIRSLESSIEAKYSEAISANAAIAGRIESAIEKLGNTAFWGIVSLALLLLLNAVLSLRAHAQGGIDVIQFQDSAGTIVKTFAAPFKIKCSTNLTCTASGSTLTMTAAGAGPGGGYATLQNATVAIAQETTLNWTAGIVCADNAGATRSDCALANIAAVSHKFFNSVVSGALVLAQPDYSDLTGVPATFASTAHNLLSASHGDTTASAAVRGDGVFAIGVTPTWQRLAHPAATGGYFKWNGTDIVASTGAASGTGTPTACSNQFVTGLTLNADAAPTSTCTTATLASAQFANQGTTTTVLHGNGAGNPSFAAVSLANDVTGQLPIANVGSAGLSGTSPVTIASTGVIACATCNTTAAVATPPFDKSATGLSNPTADATFTYPIASTTGLTLAGTAPASVSTTPGTNATSLFNINGVAGGATTNASGTGGIGSSPSITAGAGGAASGATASTGGAGGSVNFTAGAGGAGAGTGVNSNGGSIVVTPGAAGTGGSGTAGKAGVLSVAGSTAGSVFYTQGSTNTVANTNIPANSIIEQAPAAVTAYTITKPAAAANGIRLNANASALVQESFSGDSAHALTQTAKTAAVTTFTLCAATAGTACGQVGQYRVSYNFWGSGTACSAVTAGSVGLNLTWTDENAVAHTTISVPMWDQKSAANGILFNFNTALGTEGASGSYIISTNGTIIQAATTYTACTTGTGTYNLRMTVEQLQ
jgi:hypothetical protein